MEGSFWEAANAQVILWVDKAPKRLSCVKSLTFDGSELRGMWRQID